MEYNCEFKKRKRLKLFMLICCALGLLTLSLSSIFRHQLSDFAVGFCEGVSIVFIIVGIFYMGWCIGKKKNPFDLNNDKEKEDKPS